MTTNTCPFKLDLLLPDQTYAGELEISILKDSNPKVDKMTGAPHDLEATREMVALFAMAVNEQLFNAVKDKSAYAGMQLVNGTPHESVQTLEYRFAIRHIDPRAFFYLIALINQAYYVDEPVQTLCIRPLSPCDAVLDTQAFLALSRAFPEQTDTRFNVDISEDMDECDRFDVTLEFAVPIDAPLLDKIRQGLEVWDEMRIKGGFLLDFSEIEAPGNLGDIVQNSRALIQLEIDDYFEGELSALNCLIHFAARLDAEGLTIESFSVE